MEKQKTKARKVYKYPVSANWVENNIKMNYSTQLYRTGIYMIYNNNSLMQGNTTPQKLVTLVGKLKKAEDSGEITNLELGREIKVSDESGFWEEVREEDISTDRDIDVMIRKGNQVTMDGDRIICTIPQFKATVASDMDRKANATK
jgi:hypothetical protein